MFGFEPYISSQVTLKEKELKVLRESVEAASIVRVRGEVLLDMTRVQLVAAWGGGPLTS